MLPEVRKLLEAVHTPVDGVQVMQVRFQMVGTEHRWSVFTGQLMILSVAAEHVWEICHDIGHALEVPFSRMLKENMGLGKRDPNRLNSSRAAGLREARAMFIQRQIHQLLLGFKDRDYDICEMMVESTCRSTRTDLIQQYAEQYSLEAVEKLWNDRRQELANLIMSNQQRAA